MSENNNFMNLILNNADPKLMVIDFAAHDQRMTELRARRDAANPPKPEPARVEYNRLRKELFDAQEWARNAEVYCNEWAGKVKQLELRLTDLLKQKKAAVEVGNELGERTLEQAIQRLENEVLDTRAEFNRARIQSGNAGRGLKAFGGHARIAELAKELAL